MTVSMIARSFVFGKLRGEYMAGSRSEAQGAPVRHRCTRPQRWCLYETALRQAIATQHRLTDAGRLELGACEECGAPYLLQDVWQPLSEEGELACPRCGAIVVTWEGAHSFVAYWYRESRPAARGSSA